MKKTVYLIASLLITSLSCLAQTASGLNEEAMLSNINALRTDGCYCGTEEMNTVHPLHWDEDLAAVAKSYADQLKESNEKGDASFLYMSHVGTDGSTLESRLNEAEYEFKNSKENIAFIKGNISMVIDYWLNNPVSCKTIMDSEVSVMGAARSGDFWVMITAQPKIQIKKKSKVSENKDRPNDD